MSILKWRSSESEIVNDYERISYNNKKTILLNCYLVIVYSKEPASLINNDNKYVQFLINTDKTYRNLNIKKLR